MQITKRVKSRVFTSCVGKIYLCNKNIGCVIVNLPQFLVFYNVSKKTTFFLHFFDTGKFFLYNINKRKVLKYSLPGKLTIPDCETKVPAVVLIHGSGLLDMDSTVNSIKLFKELAEGLTKKGIASIRYNKRTFAYNQEMRLDFSATINDEYIEDCSSAIAKLKNDNRIDENNIFIIGHSLGVNFAPVILNLDDSIKGAILLAGAPVHILDLLLEQVKKINGQEVANQYEEEIMEGKYILEVTSEKNFYNARRIKFASI